MALSASNKKTLFRVIFWTVFLSFLFVTSPYWGPMFPPRWYERHQQRKKVAERVKAAGGWQVLRRECIALAETNEFVQWLRRSTNNPTALPPALIALRPQQVTYDSPKLFPPNSDESRIPLVRITLFGASGHSIPYFALVVVATASNANHAPYVRAAEGRRPFEYRKVSEGVYEMW